MVYPALIDYLKSRLQKPLPGQKAHMEMASQSRGKGWSVREDHRKSGVLLFLYPVKHQLHISFMKRTEDKGVHSGQISFPGGRSEPHDKDHVHTALREAEEEFSIPAHKVEVLGTLTELYIPPSNFLVYPTIGYMPDRPAFIPDPNEVAEIIEVDLQHFLRDETRNVRSISLSKDLKIKAPCFLVNDHIIWGATAMILNEFLHLLNEHRK